MDWYYTGIVYSSTAYGRTGYEAFRTVAKEYGICLGPVKEIPENAEQPDFDVIITELYGTEDLNIILTFVDLHDAKRLIITEHLFGIDRFSWVGTEKWTSEPEEFLGFEKETHGSLIVAPAPGDLTEFEEYLSKSSVEDVVNRNPWIIPALEHFYPCDNMTGQSQGDGDDDHSLDCVDLGPSGLGSLVSLLDTNDILHVINAFYALAYGSDRLRREKCINATEVVCQEFFDTFRSEELYEAVASVTFDSSGQEFSFTNKAGPAKFAIQNFQMIDANLTIMEVSVLSVYNPTLSIS